MIKTENLKLPIYNTPATDTFNLADWNEANKNLDATYKDLTDFRTKLPLINANAEIVEARNGEVSLGTKIKKVDSQLADIEQQSLPKKIGNGVLATMSDLGQDVKIAMTGGSVAVVGVGAVQEVNIVDKQVSPKKTSFIKQSINLFNKNTIANDKSISIVNGTLTSSTGYYTSNYIEINSSANIIKSHNGNIVFYDIDKVFITGQALTLNTSIISPSNAKFMRVSYYGSSITDFFMVVESNTLPSIYVPHYFYFDKDNVINPFKIVLNESYIEEGIITKKSLANGAVTPIKSLFFKPSANLFNKNTIIADNYLNTNGVISTNVGYCTSDFIEIKPSTNYLKTHNGNIVFYDVNKTFITGQALTLNTIALSPSNAKYIRVGYYGITIKDSFMLVEGNILPSEYASYVFELDDRNTNYPLKVYDRRVISKWDNKYGYCIGDSISAFNKYQPIVSELIGLKTYYNGGLAGSSFRSWWYYNNQLDLTQVDKSDLITVFLGTNDYGGNITLGTINDAIGTDSTYGSIKWLIDQILTRKPTVRLAFFTPLQRGAFESQPVYPNANPSGATLPQYVQAIKDVCKMYAIPVLDLFNLSGINSYNLASLTNDNLHPNDAGMDRIAKIMATFLETL